MKKIDVLARWQLTGLMIGLGLGLFLSALLLAIPAGQTEAAPAAPTYAVTWYTADNGGGISSSDSYEIAVTIGQTDAAAAANGGSYAVAGGFWQGLIDTLYEIFLPAIMK